MDQPTIMHDKNRFPPGFGINLIGHFRKNFGLGIASYAMAALLQKLGVPFTLYDLPVDGGDRPSDPQFASNWVTEPRQMIHPVNLFTVSIIHLSSIFKKRPGLFADERMQVANIWWEVSQFPRQWLRPLARFDAVLALSDFIAEVSRNFLPLTPVLRGDYPLSLPADIRRNRREFGMPDDAVVFVASLNPNSGPLRKNAVALVIAFRAAFPPGDTGVRLVIRLNSAATGVGQRVVEQLRQLMHGDDRIELLLEPMGYEQILSLHACADVYLSLHRAEGLGLGMLESMALGKPVIATGWSGNMSFMNYDNSAPLRYRLIPVLGMYDFYRSDTVDPNARWADPLLEDAVAWMRRLRHDPELRQELGAKAERSAVEYRHRAEAAGWLSELAALWLAQPYLPRITHKFSPAGERPTSIDTE